MLFLFFVFLFLVIRVAKFPKDFIFLCVPLRLLCSFCVNVFQCTHAVVHMQSRTCTRAHNTCTVRISIGALVFPFLCDEHVYVCLQLFACPPFNLSRKKLGFQPHSLQTLMARGVPSGLKQRSSKCFTFGFLFSGCFGCI